MPYRPWDNGGVQRDELSAMLKYSLISYNPVTTDSTVHCWLKLWAPTSRTVKEEMGVPLLLDSFQVRWAHSVAYVCFDESHELLAPSAQMCNLHTFSWRANCLLFHPFSILSEHGSANSQAPQAGHPRTPKLHHGVVISMFKDGKMTLWIEWMFGETKSLMKTYAVIAGVRELTAWGRDKYIPWFKENVLL